MSSTFMAAEKLLFTSESVTEGHPDKICDQVSDAVLDACLAQDKYSRVACETAVKTGYVMVLGEITTKAVLNFDQLIRSVINDIGYTDSEYGFDGNSCGVLVALSQQSGDIALGVDKALEAKSGEMIDKEIEAVGAGDQGMMFGFACNETNTLMPMPIYLAHKLTRSLAENRRNGRLKWLRPDGKSQVTVEYSHGKPKRVHTVLVSTQHAPDISHADIVEGLMEEVIGPTLPKDLVDKDLKVYVNPTGRFVIGGPMGDAGVTGRKIIVDSYGGMGRHGGGAFSGKDATKVDRSAAYMGRWVAKNVVAAKLAAKCEVQFAYAIGHPDPVSVHVETFGTATVPDVRIIRAINRVFNFQPAEIIDQLNLRRPIYSKTTNYGHFGKNDKDLTWEATNKVQALLKAL